MTRSPRQNQLLAALPAEDYDSLLPYIDIVRMPLGMDLYAGHGSLDHVYFPLDCVVSVLHIMEDGASAEIAVTGNDGVVGVAGFMGGDGTNSRALVRGAGHACRLRSSVLKREFEQSPILRSLLLRYIQVLLTQMAQSALCNRHHAIDQQLCRWLLNSLDRLPANRLSTTQAQIAATLGVRREGVTAAANHLEEAGLILSHRGQITVLDRAKLEARACACYGVVKRESARLLRFETTIPAARSAEG